MFKKIILVLSLAITLAIPSIVFAAVVTSNLSTQINKKTTFNTYEKKMLDDEISSQAEMVNSVNTNNIEMVTNKNNLQNGNLLTDVWLISLALFGFVMLSNRSGV